MSRYTVSTGGTEVATNGRALLDLPALGATNHNGGAVHVGPDRALYVAVGDNVVRARAQELTNPFGKILRIDRATGAPLADNPFPSGGEWQRRIFAYGLRNPFTFAFSPGTGRLHVNDVGEGTWEEINLGARGANYGWPQSEGPTTVPGVTSPVLAYLHSGDPTASGCSIAGGTFYEPPIVSFPSDYRGDYFYADFCGGWVRRLDPVSGQDGLFATGLGNIVDLTTAADGALYILGQSAITRIAPRPPLVWEDLGGRTDSAPAAAAPAGSRLVVAVRGTDDVVLVRQRDSSWGPWAALGGSAGAAPALSTWGGGRVDLFVTGTDRGLWHRSLDVGWSGYENLGGVLVAGPAASSWSPGRVDVLGTGADGALWHRSFQSGWSGWSRIGGALTSGPGAAARRPGVLDVVARGADGSVWHLGYDAARGWGRWESLGGLTNHAPAVVVGGDNPVVVATGLDGSVYRRQWTGAAWAAWEQLGGSAATGPAVTALSDGTVELLVTAPTGSVWRTALSPGQ